MKAAIYLRVSTDRQTETNQEPECRQLCEARGWEPIVFRETESGVKARPIWGEVLEMARTGKVGAVIFWSLDRVGRDRVKVAADLRELFRWGQVVVSVRESWLDSQPNSPLRGLLVDIVAWFAESERARLVERTKAGMERARAEGRKPGRKLTIAPAMAERGAALRASGLTWQGVADALVGEGHSKTSAGAICLAVGRLKRG